MDVGNIVMLMDSAYNSGRQILADEIVEILADFSYGTDGQRIAAVRRHIEEVING